MARLASDLEFLHYNHLTSCRAWIDRVFPDYFALNYAHTGRIRWSMDGGPERVLVAPVAWWTWPGPRFVYGWPEAPGWDHTYASFSGSWARQLQQAGLLPSVSGEAFQIVRDTVKFRALMLAQQSALDVRDSWRARSLLLELLLELRDTRAEPSNSRGGQGRMSEIVRMIRDQPQRQWSEAAMARRAALSRVQFRRCFHKEAGEPFRRFCIKAKLDLAARLLRMGEAPLKEVAATCGLPDIYHFSRLFRQHIGLPPGQYRGETRLMRAA